MLETDDDVKFWHYTLSGGNCGLTHCFNSFLTLWLLWFWF